MLGGLEVAARVGGKKNQKCFSQHLWQLVSYPDPRHSSGWITSPLRGLETQRKNLIDLGHDLGNRDQDKVDPGQESRS